MEKEKDASHVFVGQAILLIVRWEREILWNVAGVVERDYSFLYINTHILTAQLDSTRLLLGETQKGLSWEYLATTRAESSRKF